MALPMVYGGPGRYVQGPGELSRQGRYLSWLGCAAYVLFDQGTEDRLCRQIVDGFLDDDLSEPFFKIYDGPCTEEAVVEMAKEAQAEYCDMVVGIGGGKMLDIAKAVAFYAELPLCVCPTAASMDGPCSAISVLYHEDGSFDRYLLLEKNPDLVVVDTNVVASAPLRMTVAGMGDALATYFEARSCAAAHGANEHGGAPGHLALVAARACYDTLMECGVAVKRDLRKGRISPAVERLIECNILLSGVGFESGGLALTHAIANGLTILPECKAMHGEAVAFGLAVQLRLERAPELNQVLEFCQRVGLPTTLEGLGLGEISDADLMSVADAAFRNERNMANEQAKVTRQKLVQLMREA